MRRIRGAYVPVLAALIAALFAHVFLDVVGDYVLARDAYDGIAHGSRGLVAFVALALVLAGLAGAARALVREARGSEDAFRRLARALVPRDGRRFGALVVGLAPLALAAMGALDARVAGVPVERLDDLVGGSLALGLATSLVAALATAAVAWRLVARLACARDVLLRFVVVFVRRTFGAAARAIAAHRRVRVARRERLADRRTRGRAPPALSLVRP